jgi:hypothetical protein
MSPPSASPRRRGFVREGVLRRYLSIEGERRDGVIFSLLPEDVGAAPARAGAAPET